MVFVFLQHCHALHCRFKKFLPLFSILDKTRKMSSFPSEQRNINNSNATPSSSSMDYQETNCENDEVLPHVYVLSRIEEMTDAILYCKSQNQLDFSISTINVPAETDVIDPTCNELKNAEIIVCDPVILASNYKNMPKLKWAHCTWAGVEPLLKTMRNQPDFIVTKHSHVDFSDQIAEYVMGQVLNVERNNRLMWEAQAKKSWSEMRQIGEYSVSRPLKDLTLGILGVGNMGKAIARFFEPRGTTIVGFGRLPRKPCEFGDFDSIEESLSKVISISDYIVNTLPHTAWTRGKLDNDVLKECKKQPVVINVGRGSIMEEDTIIKALEERWVSHFILDVFPVEPLPSDSPLYHDQITITPHVAAISKPRNVAEDFIASLLRYQQKKPMENVFEYKRGY